MMWKKYGTAGQAKDDVQAHCILDNQGYRHTPGICNNYCFSTATMLVQTHPNVTFLHTLLAFLITYTGCPRRNGQNFGRVFLMLNYTDITQHTYIQS